MKGNLLIVAGAVSAIPVVDYWLFPPWWGLVIWMSAGMVALLWSIGAFRIGLGAGGRSRHAAIMVLLGTICLLVLVPVFRPIARMRIALSAEALTDLAESGSLTYPRPIQAGLFEVNSVWVDQDHVRFDLGRNPEDWELELEATLVRSAAEEIRLTDWSCT